MIKKYLKQQNKNKNMIKNITKNKILAKNKRFLNTEFQKFMGVMFAKKLNKGLIFVFRKEKLISLHMFFVFYPIDALFLDKKKKVVQLKESFKPFRALISKKPAKYVLELPEGTIKKSKTAVGDRIGF